MCEEANVVIIIIIGSGFDQGWECMAGVKGEV